MKKKISVGLLVCVAIVLSYFYANVDMNSYIYDRNTETGNYITTGVLCEGETLIQSFVAEESTIDGINVKLSLLGNVNEVVLRYTIVDAQGQELAKAMVSGQELENNKFNLLKIPQIKDTKDDTFTLVFTEENADEQNGISFYLDSVSHEGHELMINGNNAKGTLVARIVCHRFDVETFAVLLGMLMCISVFMRMLYQLFK